MCLCGFLPLTTAVSIAHSCTVQGQGKIVSLCISPFLLISNYRASGNHHESPFTSTHLCLVVSLDLSPYQQHISAAVSPMRVLHPLHVVLHVLLSHALCTYHLLTQVVICPVNTLCLPRQIPRVLPVTLLALLSCLAENCLTVKTSFH